MLIEAVLAVWHHAAGAAACCWTDHAEASLYVWAQSLFENAPEPNPHDLALHECLMKVIFNDLPSIWRPHAPAIADENTQALP